MPVSDNPYSVPDTEESIDSADKAEPIHSEESEGRLRTTSRAVLFMSVVSGLMALYYVTQFIMAMRFWFWMEHRFSVQLQFYSNMSALPVWLFLMYLLWKYARAMNRVARKESLAIGEMLLFQKRCWLTIALLAAQIIGSTVSISILSANEQLRAFDEYQGYGPRP